MSDDKEVAALRVCYAALAGLTPDELVRVLRWLRARHAADWAAAVNASPLEEETDP